MAKKTKAKAEKKAAPKKVETKPIIPTAEETKVEEVAAEEIKPEEVNQPKEDKKEEKKEEKNPLPIEPEVIDPAPSEDDKAITSISAGLNKVANGDRIDHNHAVDLMKMIHTEYVGNPTTPANLGKAMKQQFDAMALVELMFYNAQLENDFQQLGVKVNQSMFTQMEKVARETFGITLKGLPAPDDPRQTIINFPESIPQEVKEQVKKDIKIKKQIPEIPAPDATLPNEKKLDILKAIFSQIGGGIGVNVERAIEWSRDSFSFAKDEKKSVILASILKHDFKTTLTNGLSGMVKGKLDNDHSVLGAHALLHSWLPKYTDQEISELVQVLLSYKEESNVKSVNSLQDGPKSDINKSLEILSKQVAAGCASKVVDAVLNKKENVAVEYADGIGSIIVNTMNLRKGLITSYGESESILKDKIKELVGYYTKPIARLDKYIDKSAYSA